MIYINEWLPNPIGRDDSVTGGEFVELYNSAASATSLNGYTLGDGAKKRFKLDGYSVPAGGYLVLTRAQDKLTLKNTDGEVLLYGPDGRVVDGASFAGAAPEGKSYSRTDYGTAPIAHFVFTYPTPGAVNKTIDTSVAVQNYPAGVSLAQHLSPGAFIVLMFCVGAFFLIFFVYVIQKNRNLSDFFFGRNKEGGV